MNALVRRFEESSLVTYFTTSATRKWCLTPLIVTPLIVVFSYFAGCSFGIDTKTLEWKEEVKIRDGRVVTVRRANKYEKVSELPGRSSWALRSSTLDVDTDVCSTKPTVRDAKQALLAFDLVDGKCYIVGRALSSAGTDYPNLKYPYLVSYVVDRTQARGIPLAEVPLSVDVNLYIPLQEDIDAFSKQVLSLKDKESARAKLLGRGGIPRVFRSIWSKEH